MDKKDLLDLINDDDLGLLDLDKKSVSATPDDRLAESFMEINEFFELHNAEPKSGGDIHEHKLASRLKHIRENKGQRDFLSKYDTHGLLEIEKKDLDTVSDIFEDDDLDLLSIEDSSVFNIKNVPNLKTRLVEMVAKRKISKNFSKFEDSFKRVHEEIKNKKKTLVPFNDSGQIEKGVFFVTGGVLGFVVEMPELKKDAYRSFDGRLYCVFENGTESNLLFRSLIKTLQAESTSRIVRDFEEVVIDDLDQESGYIYVLKSLSENPRIAAIHNLFKIGFSATTVESRIKNAEQDPTYLMAPVSIVATYKCFNMNPQRFERLMHRFFSNSCLDIQVTNKEGHEHTPREWFIAPIGIISIAIELIIKGEIVNYSYDKNTESIVKVK